MKILGIETSCDETAAAIVENGTKVLSNVIASSVDLHAQTGGVVPEVAAREHMKQISPVVDKALEDANCNWDDIDAISVTNTPGLVSSLLIGVNTAQTIAYIKNKPFIPIHHISGHIYANWLGRKEEDIKFPILILTVSGGHNELILMKDHHDFEVIGETLDDAAGEAFDKVARLLGLGYPGGPVIAKAAEKGDSNVIKLPLVMLDKNNKYNFSFSGLKSAVLRVVNDLTENESHLREDQINNIAASFQNVVIDVLAKKLVLAAEEYNIKAVHLAGGVSANQLLRKIAREKLPESIDLLWPKEMIYCTDNAAMIASSAYFLQKYKSEKIPKEVKTSSQSPLH